MRQVLRTTLILVMLSPQRVGFIFCVQSIAKTEHFAHGAKELLRTITCHIIWRYIGSQLHHKTSKRYLQIFEGLIPQEKISNLLLEKLFPQSLVFTHPLLTRKIGRGIQRKCSIFIAPLCVNNHDIISLLLRERETQRRSFIDYILYQVNVVVP